MEKSYGLDRVILPKGVFPASAWQLDNSYEIKANELRIKIKKIHIETSSFFQFYAETYSNETRFIERIKEVVQIRGKLHNPNTNTGGVLYGEIEAIGKDYDNAEGYKVGDEVICSTSLAAIPLSITDVLAVDTAYCQIDVKGYAIIHSGLPLVRRPKDLPIDILLVAFDESGTMYQVAKEAKGKNRFLVVGTSVARCMLFGSAIRQSVGKDATFHCVLDTMSFNTKAEKDVEEVLKKVFTHVSYHSLLRPVEVINEMSEYEPFDMSVICTDLLGAETINVCMTKEHGTVMFTEYNIGNYNNALFITESIPRDLEIKCAVGYQGDYASYDIDLVRQIAPYLNEMKKTYIKIQKIKRNEMAFNSTDAMAKAESFVAKSKRMRSVLDDIMKVSKYDCNVLIVGQTGVGKEKIANMIQKNSGRKSLPFIKINCAAISPNLIESELFGYEKGAFTGANTSGKKGYFETADNGTIFLDEVGELPLDVQAKLLRVIQEGEFMRVGGNKSIHTNVRLISATNRVLEDMVNEKTFRQDLYYRLNVFQIKIPSLAERTEDIPPLIDTFATIYSKKFGIDKTFEDSAKEYMQKMPWPGNIRELENTVQRLLISSVGNVVTVMDLVNEKHSDIIDSPPTEDDIENIDLSKMVEEYELRIIQRAYEKYGSTRKAAKALGISQTQFVRKNNIAKNK